MQKVLSKFEESNKQQKVENEAHAAIIRRYDEVLCDKVSKHSLEEVTCSLGRKLKHFQNLLDDFKTMTSKT